MFGSSFTKRDLKSYDETIMLYGNMALGEWRIVHIHYSGMPETGEREGF